MTKFKVGDVVERTGRISGVWRAFAAQDTGPYIVTSTTSGGWIQLNGYESIHEGLGKHPFDDNNFTLVEQDDPLPPAPESAMFREAVTGNTLSVRVREWDNNVEVWSADRGGSVCLSAEETLQLAHDLTRMAMEIKRREKQNA